MGTGTRWGDRAFRGFRLGAAPAGVLTLLAVGCTAAPTAVTPPASGADAAGSMPADASAPPVDAPRPPVDAGVDQPLPSDAGSSDLPADAPVADAPAADGPKAWPPPGTDYLTKLETIAQYNQLVGMRGGLPFIIRRLANDKTFPYPWDRYECVFEHGMDAHLEFLERMDPMRAFQIYFVDAKSPGGSLIPGRMAVDGTDRKKVHVTFENVRLLTPTDSSYPLDPAVIPIIRDRITRCVSFATTFVFSMICPGGQPCPLP